MGCWNTWSRQFAVGLIILTCLGLAGCRGTSDSDESGASPPSDAQTLPYDEQLARMVAEGAAQLEGDADVESVVHAYAVAYRAMEAGKAQEALGLFETILAQHPTFVPAQLGQARAFERLGRCKEAIRAYRRVIRNAPNAVEAYVGMGTTYSQWGKPEQAITALQKALWLAPNATSTLYALGTAYDAAGRHRDAEFTYRRLTQLQPEYPQSWANLGRTLIVLERYGDAEEALQKALAADPEFATAITLRGVICDRRGDLDRAAELHRQAVHTDPGHALALSNLCDALLRQDKAREAVREATWVAGQIPRQSWVYIMRAQAHDHLGDHKRGIADWTRALELQPHASTYLGRAVTHVIMGQEERACADALGALELDADQHYASLLLWVIQTRRGDREEARQSLADIVVASDEPAWTRLLVRYCRNEIDAASLMAAADETWKECEACYYIGESVAASEGMDAAREWFQRCVRTEARTFIEYRLARWRLAQSQR
ncbi:MAG: tetratricopeptide repeat protein [Planctomycetes bacterium]|nr:tetratricopeptide repeat protein [Planctomycetota bacterium]